MDLHANLFRSTFSDPAQAEGLLRCSLPPVITAAIDWGTLTLCDTTFTDQDVRHSNADLLFSVMLGGRPALVYLLVEHKSTEDPLTAFQMLRYVVRIWEHWLREHPGSSMLPPILPIVVHHGSHTWRVARDLAELIDLEALSAEAASMLRPLLPRLRFQLVDLPAVEFERLHQSAMPPLARLVLMFQQFLRDQDAARALAVVRAAIDLVRKVHTMPGGSERLDQVWYYAFKVSDLRLGELSDLLATQVDPHAGGTVKTTADRIREEEHARFEQDLAERTRQNQASILLRLAQKRFGAIPDAMRDRIGSATVVELDAWLDAVVTAPTLAALFGN